MFIRGWRVVDSGNGSGVYRELFIFFLLFQEAIPFLVV